MGKEGYRRWTARKREKLGVVPTARFELPHPPRWTARGRMGHTQFSFVAFEESVHSTAKEWASPREPPSSAHTPLAAERSGSRVSILGGFRHTVSRATVCPLGQPNQAIGLESQIEPWLAQLPATLLRGARAGRTE
jgi:hypothetical protein